jgi:hypothetical protein
MNSDDIYKFIGYAVVIIFLFYIVSKSLNFQLKIIEGMTAKEEQEEREKKKADTEKKRVKKETERKNAEIIKTSIIRDIKIRNNKNLTNFEIIDKLLLEEYNNLITNYIEREKIRIFDIINSKNTTITFNSIYDKLIIKCQNIESLQASRNYLAATSGTDLKEDVEPRKDEPTPAPPPKETDAQKKQKKEAEEKRKKEETTLREILKGNNEDDLKYNTEDIESIASTDSDLKNNYIELLNAYKTEEIITIADLMLTIGEDSRTYNGNMNQIANHNKNITTLTTTETILTELFGGGVGKTNVKKKGGKDNIKKGAKGDIKR